MAKIIAKPSAFGRAGAFLLLFFCCKTSLLVNADEKNKGGNRLLLGPDNYWSNGGGGSLRGEDETRIAGGFDTPVDRFPYYVALHKGNEFTCGGTLIASNIVLTAAHCDIGLTHAFVGKHERNDERDAEEIKIEKVYKHPNWDEATGSFDQMLLELKSPSTKPYIGNVNTDPTIPVEYVDSVTVIGLGRLSYQGNAPSVLQAAATNSISNHECGSYVGPSFDYTGVIVSSNICVVGSDGQQGQCNGDSGGPYLKLGSSHLDDTIVGLVSWGIRCSETGAPGVGSRLSSSDWIETQACDIAAEPLPALCRIDLMEAPSESPSMAPSTAPSESPSMAPSRDCKSSFNTCSSNAECCEGSCQLNLCRPQQSRVSKRYVSAVRGSGGGVRGGAAGRPP